MSTQAKGTFEVKTWDEKPYSEIEGGGKLTRARVIKSFHGDIEGEGTMEYLMIYRVNGPTNFYGLERVVGRVGGKAGSFVLEHKGTDDGYAAKTTWLVVSGSGTGDLRGLKGEGGFVATRETPQVSFTLDYDL